MEVLNPAGETWSPAAELSIPATDGLALAASSFGRGGPLVVVNPATGVRRGYYKRFAELLGESGFRALTFDYRGIGGSRPARLRGFPARMRDGAERDTAGVFAWARERHGDERLLVVGHSFGGQGLGLLPEPECVGAALLVCAQSGYWRHWPGPRAWAMWALWHALIPGLVAPFGRFPSRLLGMGEDLPAHVALEWARWGRHPDYILSGEPGWRERFARLKAPIRSLSFEDDGFAPSRAVDALLSVYPTAPREHRHLRPAELGVPAVGHWGFFRERFRGSLWREAVGWLRAHAERTSAL